MKTTTRILSMAAACASLAACGGGDDGPDAPPAGVPLAAAMASQINQAKSGAVSIAGTVSASGQTVNVTGSGTYTEATTAATFEGVQGLRKHLTLNGSVTVSGQTAPLTSSSDAYYDSSYKPLGSTAAGSYCVTTAYTALPATVQAGATGTWYTQDCYASSAKLAKLASGLVTYTMEADSGTSLLLKLTTRVTDTAGNTLPATSTYRVTSAGAATRLNDMANVSLNGASLNLTITYQ